MKAEGQAGRVTSSFILHPSDVVHTSSGNSTKREAVEPLAALAGVEVCDLTFATSVPPLFRAIPQIQS